MKTSIDGLLVIDKPPGMTSRAALDRCLRWFPRGTAVGHTGTLDPLATGVLVLCIGSATRLAEYVQRMAKTYHAVIQLGATSDSDDADGTITPRHDAQPPERAELQRALAEFIGVIEQVPPAYSAAKVTGRRAYELARQGRTPELTPRPVHIHGIDLLRYEYPELEVRVRCGKGTYIRSLARDLGERLGCGGYIMNLRREQVGPFKADESLSPESSGEEARSRLLPLSAAVVELPTVQLTDEEARRLRQGQRLSLSPASARTPGTEEAAVFHPDGSLVGIVRIEEGCLVSTRILPSEPKA